MMRASCGGLLQADAQGSAATAGFEAAGGSGGGDSGVSADSLMAIRTTRCRMVMMSREVEEARLTEVLGGG